MQVTPTGAHNIVSNISPKEDSRSTEELFDVAANSENNDEAREALWALRYRGDREIFVKAKELCESGKPRLRELGVDILCQLGIPQRAFPDECTDILLNLLSSEVHPHVLSSIGWGLGHLEAERGIEPLSKLRKHSDAEVRFAVVGGLLGFEDDLAIATLIELSRDEDDDVRDWATFGLGTQIEVDRQDIRDALADRLLDTHDDTRAEALFGLAKRNDPWGLAPLIRELSSDCVGSLSLEAAGAYGSPELYPLLVAISEWWAEGDSVLDAALTACAPSSGE